MLKVILLLLVGTVAFATPFPDVPPCHWAAGAVARISSPHQPTPAEALASESLALNSLTQVFEGLRCGDTVWSLRFLETAPAAFSNAPAIEGFRLEPLSFVREGTRATVAFVLELTRAGETLRREGEATLLFVENTWRVRYSDLNALDLPLFP